MLTHTLKSLLVGTILIVVSWLPAIAQIAQEPLLNRPNTVAPNLTLILDTSGSMDVNYIYQYGGSPDGYGMDGPSTKTYAKYSPDVNLIYYDPRIRYLPRINYDGTYQTKTVPTLSSTSWKLYFRKTTGVYTTSQLGSTSDYYTSTDSLPASVAPVVSGSPTIYPTSVTSTILQAASTKFPKFVKRSDCTANTSFCTATEEAQNWSNWNKWYDTRGLMATTGMGAAFEASLKPDSIRLGYGTIDGLNGKVLDRGVSSYDSAPGGVKDKFFTWLYSRTFNSSTPNLTAVNNAGKYYERSDSDGPWATTPNPASTGISTVISPSGPGKSELSTSHASCRRSFSMLVTDGYSNGSVPTVSDIHDNTSFSQKPAVGPAFSYTPIGPFKGSDSNTLADIAMHYWGTDLRTLPNRVPVIKTAGTADPVTGVIDPLTAINNPSSWQNVSFYAVTLGIIGNLSQTKTTLDALTSGSMSWPKPVIDTPSTIDDLWHATINGRGSLLNAKNSSDLTTGLKGMFSSIAGDKQTLSGVAVSTTFLNNGTRKYKPEYIPGTWSGKLSAIELDPNTGNETTTTVWQVESGVNASGDPISTIPAAASRNIVTWNGSAAVPFDSSITVSSTNNSDLINYLRGDSTKELRKTGGVYRTRDAILGDIVNSSPVFVKDNVDIGYEKLSPALGDYRTFVAGKVARTEGVLFVGANDGMLHAFRDATGVETFAYVPKAVVPNLYKLSETPYTHQYFVDGPNVETDAYLDSTWKNVLLGTTGAGAKAVYALDVSNPLSMSASKVMWEINATGSFANLGHVLSDVQSGVLGNGDWVAIFGNGYSSASGAASLFVVNLATGALLKEINTGAAGGNGLGGVRIVRGASDDPDPAKRNRILGAYAGDLKGNLWKFDLSGAATDWKVGLSGSPLYIAKDDLAAVQPITAAPAVLAHPNGGYLVSFGTGKFFEASDVTNLQAQRLYGIWDKQPFSASVTSTPTGAAFAGLSQLTQQTITTVPVTVGTSTTNYFKVSSNIVTWGDGLTGTRGWYVDLPNSGQRVAYPIERLTGTFILATTLSPVSSATSDVCVQTGSGSGWAYVIEGLTGSGPSKQILNTNGDLIIDGNDALVSGWQDAVDGRPTPIALESTKLRDSYCIETAQVTCTKVQLECGQLGAKACPPAAIPGFKSRQWRQLFMR